VHFRWVKAHNGIQGNELVDQLAKEAAEDEERITVFRKTLKNTIVSEAKKRGLWKWQEEWTNTTNGAVTKSFFPSVQQRLRLAIQITPEFTSMFTGQGNTRSHQQNLAYREAGGENWQELHHKTPQKYSREKFHPN
jgi:hypothetical protein